MLRYRFLQMTLNVLLMDARGVNKQFLGLKPLLSGLNFVQYSRKDSAL